MATIGATRQNLLDWAVLLSQGASFIGPNDYVVVDGDFFLWNGTAFVSVPDYQGDPNGVGPLTAAQVQAVRALVDGSGVDVAFTRAHDSLPQAYVLDAGGAGLLRPMRFTVNAPTDVIAAERIRTGGVNTFETTIAASSLTGEVIVVAVGAGAITSLHVGHSDGVAQTLATTDTASVNQLAKFTCLEADDCNAVYVRFAPPRASGRYCDVSVVGKRRA